MISKWRRMNNASNISHVLMDGGVLSVPNDELDEFHNAYIRSLNKNEKLFVVEQKTQNYNFFIDLDYKSNDEFYKFEEIFTNVCKCVKNYTENDALICIQKPRQCGEKMKFGCHIIWSGFVVNKMISLTIRDRLISEMKCKYPNIKWEEVIDCSVYGKSGTQSNGSGLRMLWSHKMSKHVSCNGTGCEQCVNGKIVEGYYIPYAIFKSGLFDVMETIDEDKRKPNIEILKKSILRTQNCISNVGITITNKDVTEYKGKDITSVELKNELQTYIRKHLEGQSKANILRICETNGSFYITTDSKYCSNIKKKHNSNHIWFHVYENYIFQRCFCECLTLNGRYSGHMCKNYEGKHYLLDNSIKEKLNHKNKKNNFQNIKKNKNIFYFNENYLKIFISKNIFFEKENFYFLEVNKKKGDKCFDVVTNLKCNTCNMENVKINIKNTIVKPCCNCRCREYKISNNLYVDNI